MHTVISRCLRTVNESLRNRQIIEMNRKRHQWTHTIYTAATHRIIVRYEMRTDILLGDGFNSWECSSRIHIYGSAKN